MTPATVARSVRNILSVAETNINRMAGRELVPMYSDTLSIETSSICNLECTFCAYGKKVTPRINMTNELFASCIAQAVDMGYRHFMLTPSTGDIFMDRRIFDKLELLERNDRVGSYEFYTNFTIPKASSIERLIQLGKLRSLTLSVYGHDLETFVAITKSTPVVYRRLLANLETLLKILDRAKCKIDIAIRSTRDMPRRPETDLLRLLDRFKAAGIRVKVSKLYHNWGGQVSSEDQNGLAIDILKPGSIYKNGACTLLFTGVQILANGVVHACACVDANATLQIGDLNKNALREIVSTQNPEYMKLIEEQQRGKFPAICQECGFYKSIYHTRTMYRKQGIPTESIEGFKTALDARNLRARSKEPAVG